MIKAEENNGINIADFWSTMYCIKLKLMSVFMESPCKISNVPIIHNSLFIRIQKLLNENKIYILPVDMLG